jgi:hypothetical protein
MTLNTKSDSASSASLSHDRVKRKSIYRGRAPLDLEKVSFPRFFFLQKQTAIRAKEQRQQQRSSSSSNSNNSSSNSNSNSSSTTNQPTKKKEKKNRRHHTFNTHPPPTYLDLTRDIQLLVIQTSHLPPTLLKRLLTLDHTHLRPTYTLQETFNPC